MTKMTRWNPAREIEEMGDLMRSFFSNSVPQMGTQGLGLDRGEETMKLADWAPRVDITESHEEYIIQAELPGLKKEEVKVRAKEGMLTIEGERRKEKEEKGKRFHRIERSYGTFLRTFAMPDDVNDEKLYAEFKNGVLAVHLPRSDQSKKKSVDIKIH